MGTGRPAINREYHEFNSIEFIGNGGFGRVYKVQKKNGNDVNELYALKEVSIDPSAHDFQVARRKIANERKVLELVNGFHFCVQMQYAFALGNKYHLVLDYYPRGDLFSHLKRYPQLKYNTARLCAAEMLLALEFLHGKGIIYRDLKPENILIDRFGHLVLTDFGLSAQLREGENVHECEGTFNYLAPEAVRISPTGFGHAVDFWSLGCVLYEMLVGRVPFEIDDEYFDDQHSDQFLTWCILYSEPEFNYQHFRDHPIAKQFLKEILTKEPAQRLGVGPDGLDNIKNHQFFNDINWQYVHYKQYTVLGELPAERNDDVPIVLYSRNTIRKTFVRNGYDFVSMHLSAAAERVTATSKLEKILGPSERSYDALYDTQREPRFQLYSKKIDCHMMLPKSKIKPFIKRWMTAGPNDGNMI